EQIQTISGLQGAHFHPQLAPRQPRSDHPKDDRPRVKQPRADAHRNRTKVLVLPPFCAPGDEWWLKNVVARPTGGQRDERGDLNYGCRPRIQTPPLRVVERLSL